MHIFIFIFSRIDGSIKSDSSNNAFLKQFFGPDFILKARHSISCFWLLTGYLDAWGDFLPCFCSAIVWFAWLDRASNMWSILLLLSKLVWLNPLRSLIEIICVFHVIRNYDKSPFKGLSIKMVTPFMHAMHMLSTASIKRDEHVFCFFSKNILVEMIMNGCVTSH